MAKNTIKAKVHSIGEIKTFNSKSGEFKKRELILDASRFDPYTGEKSGENFLCIEFANKRCEELNDVRVGDIVNVSYVLQGRQFKDSANVVRHFTTIVGIDVEIALMKKQEVQSAVQTLQDDFVF